VNAISLWQPWATLWLLTDPDEKVFETRHWYCSHRGLLFVHAAKTRNAEVRGMLECRYVQERLAAHGLSVADLPFGALAGTVDLIGCSRMDRMPQPSEREQRVGNWSPERFAWERGPKTRIFTRSIPFVGKQGFFRVPYALVAPELLGAAYAPEKRDPEVTEF
jgi:hypothetical protein